MYGLTHDEALKRVEGDAVELLTSELEKIVKYSPKRYVAILQAISLGVKSWSEIKHFAEGVAGDIPDNRFNPLLQNLVKYGFIERTEKEEYRPIENLLPKAVKILRSKYKT
jgi:AAA+ ATPase superfamily predicted ATPase